MWLLNRWSTALAAVLALFVVWRLVLAGVTVTPVGWLPYDDEGYFLITVQGVLDGKPLYDETYSQYGPTYYLTELALRRLTHLPVTHDGGRRAIVALWIAIFGLTAWWVGRLTSSLAWAAVTLAAVGGYCLPRGVNPGLPQWFLLLLLTALIGLTTMVHGADKRSRTILAGAGALAAALALTKINSGAYLTVALGLAVLAALPRSGWTIAAYVVGVAAAAALPLAIMSRDLAAGHVALPLVTSVAVIGSAVAAWTGEGRGALTPRALALLLGGFAGGAALLCALALLLGTSLHGLVTGVITAPLELPHAFWIPEHSPPGALALSLASLVACSLVCSGLMRRVRDATRRWDIVAARVGCAALATYAWLFAREYFIACGAAYVWVILLPSSVSTRGRWAFARLTLAFAAVLHTLYAYPVPGYQVVWATFLLIPAAVLCLADAAIDVAAMVSDAAAPIVRRALELTALAGLIAAGMPAGVDTIASLRRLLVPLDLPGAQRILVSPEQAAQLHWLTANLRAHCDTFVSKPGLNSLYFWTGLQPPTGLNAGAWMILLDSDQQARIVTALSSHARVCAVRNATDAAFWLRGHDLSSGDPQKMPLARYIDERFSTVASAAGYEFRLPPARDDGSFRNYLLFAEKRFDGSTVVRVPAELLSPQGSMTVEAWMRTRADGVVLGCQSSSLLDGQARDSLPLFYVGSDGRFAGQRTASPEGALRTAQPVNDGAWHLATLVASPSGQSFYVDGTLAGRRNDPSSLPTPGSCQIGTADTSGWPSAPLGWMPFRGDIADVSVIGRELSESDIRQDYAQGPGLSDQGKSQGR